MSDRDIRRRVSRDMKAAPYQKKKVDQERQKDLSRRAVSWVQIEAIPYSMICDHHWFATGWEDWFQCSRCRYYMREAS